LWGSSMLPGVAIPSGAVVFPREPDNEP
jgi:hypothetical protein